MAQSASDDHDAKPETNTAESHGESDAADEPEIEEDLFEEELRIDGICGVY